MILHPLLFTTHQHPAVGGWFHWQSEKQIASLQILPTKTSLVHYITSWQPTLAEFPEMCPRGVVGGPKLKVN
ncbi:hypothetical protein XELAEV_18039367mg [Xenopus laevis]|uniref:Uncharacterized protein n=1 Tax=Xenopus laevis TaxID=8355 RepID=A0A974H8A9_XENLA|nr:hypothetical protein XELAEV_18039367mg [Xenopus laevis]